MYIMSIAVGTALTFGSIYGAAVFGIELTCNFYLVDHFWKTLIGNTVCCIVLYNF